MSTPETLIKAIRERIAAGHSKEEIQQEAAVAGHTTEVFEAAYVLAAQSTTAEQFPAASTLWLEGLSFVKSEWKLALVIALPLALIGVADVLLVDVALNTFFLTLATILSVAALAIYLIGLMVALRMSAQPPEQRDYKEALHWVKRNFLSLLWVYLLVVLAVWGGIVLLIIPGLIVGLLLYFSLYAVVFNEAKGEKALTYSRRLVKGRFWLVAGKVIGIGLYNFVALMVLFTVGGIAALAVQAFVSETFLFASYTFLSQFVGVVFSLLSMYAGAVLYQVLAKDISTAEPSLVAFRLFIGLGVLAFMAIAAVVAYVVYMGDEIPLFEALESQNTMQTELAAVQLLAPAYRLSNSGSFEGFCEFAAEQQVMSGEVECAASSEAWAIGVGTESDRFCADSTGFNKAAKLPNSDSLTCIER